MNESNNQDVDFTNYSVYKAGIFIWKIIPPILIIFGTTGNILSIVVLRRKNIQKSVCSIYFVVLAVSDLIVLHTGLLRQWILMTFNVDIRQYGSAICKLHTFIVYFSLDFSSWILVAVTIERVCLVWFPQKAKRICTKRLASSSLVVIAILLLLINCHMLYGVDDHVKYVNGSMILDKCAYISDDYKQFWMSSWPWVDLAMFCGAPFCCLLIGNLLIFIKVLLSKRAVKRQVAPSIQAGRKQQKKDSKLSSMSVMLFTLNTMFLICTSPISVYLIGYPTWSASATGRSYAVLDMMWSVVNILMYTNNSINFLLYVLSGSRFRREFKDLFKRRKQNANIETVCPDSVARVHPVSAITSPKTVKQTESVETTA